MAMDAQRVMGLDRGMAKRKQAVQLWSASVSTEMARRYFW